VEPQHRAELALSGCVVDVEARVVRYDDGSTTRLTDLEAELLRYLSRTPNQPVAAGDIERDVWNMAPSTVSRAVSASVGRLRKKIEPDSRHPINLQTVFGVGWRLRMAEPAAPPSPTPGLAPAAPRDLVGRHDTLEELSALLAEGTRVVTLGGPPGVGKTRVLQELAGRWTRSTPIVVDLDDLQDLQSVSKAVSAALQPGAGQGSARQAADSELGPTEPVLLLLDHVEHCAGALVELVPSWLARRPALQVLVACSVMTGPPRGTRVALEPLPAPTHGKDLLLQRLRQAAIPEPTPEQAVRIARALDGLPLAIELAVERLHVLDPESFLDSLDEPGLLADPSRPGPARHRDLDQAILSAWVHLDDQARRVLVDLTAFAGPTSLHDLDAVSDCGRVGLLDGLGTLLAARLVRRQDDGRFAMLRTVRTAVRRHHPVPDSVRTRHARWALDHGTTEDLLVAAHAPDAELSAHACSAAVSQLLLGGDKARALACANNAVQRLQGSSRLRVEVARLAVWTHLGREQDVIDWTPPTPPSRELARRIANLRTRALARLGRYAQAATELAPFEDDPLDSSDDLAATRVRAVALLHTGGTTQGIDLLDRVMRAASVLGDASEAAFAEIYMASHLGSRTAIERVIEQHRHAPARMSSLDRACAYVVLAELAWQAGLGRDALGLASRGRDCALTDEDTGAHRKALSLRMYVLTEQGRLAQAQDALHELLPLSEGVRQAHVELLRARLAWLRGQASGAVRMLREAHELATDRGSAVHALWCAEGLAEVLLDQGALDEALHWSTRAFDGIDSATRAQRLDTTPAAIHARVLLAQSHAQQAEQVAEQALESARDSGVPYDAAHAWFSVGQVALHLGDLQRARQAARAMRPLLERMGIRPDGWLGRAHQLLLARSHEGPDSDPDPDPDPA